MKDFRYTWLVGLIATLVLIGGPLLWFVPWESEPEENPWQHLPVRPPHTDHSTIIEGPFESPHEVTLRCLDCHEDAAHEVMQTTHWTWESRAYDLDRRDEPVTVGKKNSLNNFCIGIQSNWEGCTSCHAGYGWSDANFDFSDPSNVDCLVCHETSGTYVKGNAGMPVEGVDLTAAAQSVAWPERQNCGGCHFEGGGGNAVKHGDLSNTLVHPTESVDVHMGGLDFACTDCHQTDDHQIRGRSISVSLDLENQAYCTDCHEQDLHADERLNAHVDSVACQTCHIPAGAPREPTKMEWDWSTAGQDRPEDHYEYLRIKGSFVYETDFVPEYYWYSGVEDRYLLGDPIDPDGVTEINSLAGHIYDPEAVIFPFKVHRAWQPYDAVNNVLLQPKTVGEGGFWSEFDWDQALELGAEAVGMEYSGEYGFAETVMYWTQSHMVAPSGEALQCGACHSEDGRLDWEALGYPGDPAEWGGRFSGGWARSGESR
ncbi:MAG: tetrathionate reductase family octaheme c-type cytochrome [Anaerolineales bacterium]|nr:tetrathionate reductase family octaheme c-type cytochrome [Anaerolineales bacterium]